MRIRFLRGLIPALALAALPTVSSAGVFVGVSVNLAPPPLPVYEQPACPEEGYLWSPGYWAWDDDAGAYYWVPGTWVLPPEVGMLWTPGFWGWGDGAYRWHEGYWGRHVGFYGGVHYGFGYDGDGFEGGYWRGSRFFYNRAVVHVGPTFVTNVYNRPVVYHNTYEHVSFNGGPGGTVARPDHEQIMAEHEHHHSFTSVQQRQERMAFADRSLRADYNHGRPPIAATARPAEFHGNGAFAARAAGGPIHAAAFSRGAEHRAAPMRSDRPSWATGQPRAGHSMERGAPAHGQAGFSRPEPRHFQSRPEPQHFQSRPEPQHFQSRPEPQHFQSRPEPQHFQSRPEPQHFQSRPEPQHFQSRPEPQHFQSRPVPQHFEPRPQAHFSPQGGGPGGHAPAGRPQERGGDRHPPGHNR
ncbi:MAG TPA: hypothetical protein VIC29_06580 [Steroidobacteraceae bacterium]